MKRWIITGMLLLLGISYSIKASAQATEIAQLLLNVEKLAQLEQILDDMKKGYKTLTGGYNLVKDVTQGNFNLHKTFLDGLMQVSPQVKNYRKVAGIIELQLRLVKQYKTAFNRFKSSNLIRDGEIDYLQRVYGNLFDKSLKNLDDLATVVTANKLRMSDDERLSAIDRIYKDMENKVSFLKHFNSSTDILVLQRKKEKRDIQSQKALLGIE